MTAFPSQLPTQAVLFDFGGVLTASVLESFADVSEEISGDRSLIFRVLTTDKEAMDALVEHEEGRSEDEVFEHKVAARLSAAGAPVAADNLIARLQTGLKPDSAMIDLVAQLRDRGVPVGLVSNSLGRNCYDGFDLDSMFDVQAISGIEGVRKPSARLYTIACERLGVDPKTAVMIDDLEPNVIAATRLGMGGIVHNDADRTVAVLEKFLEVNLVRDQEAS